MSVALILTRGLGNGSFDGDASSIVTQGFLGGSVSVSITAGGTIVGMLEAVVVSAGGTLTLTLVDDTWIAAGTGPIGTIAQSDAIVDGITSIQSEAGGWNAQIRDVLDYTDLARTSNTVATLTVPATAGYSITENETITATVPAAVLTTADTDIDSNSFQVKADAEGITTIRNPSRDIVTNVVTEVVH